MQRLLSFFISLGLIHMAGCAGAPRRLAWVGYSVSVGCETDCKVSGAEQKKIAEQIANRSFASLNQEVGKTNPLSQIQKVKETVSTEAFKNADIKNGSLRSKVSRWFDHLKLSQSTTVTANGLRAVNPDELGWAGEESLRKLAHDLGVSGTIVGRVDVKLGARGEVVSEQPKFWVFNASETSRQ